MIPLQYLGVSDVDLSNLPLNEVMMFALTNIEDTSKEGGYAVCHSHAPVSDFGMPRPGESHGPHHVNPLAAAFPLLFPYGIGGIEEERKKSVGFNEHVRWALQYHDRRFRTHHSFPFVVFGISQKREALRSARVQMKRRDFDCDALALASLTVADLKKAEKEEANRLPISNPRVRLLRKHVFATSGRVMGSDPSRAAYRGKIWGTCLILRGPSVWLTINPCDLHDPIAQVLVGEDINMDAFNSFLGPNSNRRAHNIAKDPYAAAKFFFFVVETVLETLFQIRVKGSHVLHKKGLLGHMSGYFGVVESQGRGTLHIHTLIWLKDAPNSEEMHHLLQLEAFRERIRAYIRENIKAHLDALSEDTIRAMPRESELPYSRPPNPDLPDWEAQLKDQECRAVRSQQIHTCKRSTCLRINQFGKLACKRQAPWELSDDDVIDEHGNWRPRRSYAYLNNYCPAISTTLHCNNDIKLITNGRDTNDVTWYTSAYQTKKQGKTHNLSALMANSLMYHQEHSSPDDDLLERNRLLLFRCHHTINREAEIAGPLVMAYLMGWGDTICSHHYVPIYWSSLASMIWTMFPNLRKSTKRSVPASEFVNHSLPYYSRDTSNQQEQGAEDSDSEADEHQQGDIDDVDIVSTPEGHVSIRSIELFDTGQ